MPHPSSVFIKKPVADILAVIGGSDSSASSSESSEPKLKRSLTVFELATIGIGCTVGTGIFYIFSQAVPLAGPAVTISFLIASIVAGLTALSYAELASTIPASGSSYTYSYAIMGELVAYMVGWCLLLEYAVSAAAVAVGWSEYLNDFLKRTIGWQLPDYLSHSPWAPGAHGFGINLPALILVVLCALLLIRGTSESAKVNAIMVVIKLTVLLLFSIIAFTGFHAGNFTPFAPFGLAGIGSAAGLVFFTFVGLDVVATASEEIENPGKSIPLALLIALGTVTAFYLIVAIAALGAQKYNEFHGQEAGLSRILENVTHSSVPSIVLSAAAVISIFSITLVTIFGQTRVLFAMSRDGMIPAALSKINPRTLTPIFNTIIVAICVGVLAALAPLDFLADLVSIGTLAAFIIVSIGVIILRKKAPDLPRGFKVPLFPLVPILSVLSCVYLITQLRTITWILFFMWMILSLISYWAYSYHHSVLRKRMIAEDLVQKA